MRVRAVRVPAQGKINLFLRILARETTGYHQLETLFLRIDLSDEVVVRTAVRGRSIDCRGADVGPAERNLAYRAAMAMRDAGGPDAFAIEIDKRIPVGAGLGGGSADAAAVLRALNACRTAPLPDDALLALAAGLGADVPFLASRATMALAWGRGERMIQIEPPPSRGVVLVAPHFGVSTAEAYGWWDADAGGPGTPRVLSPASLSEWRTLAELAGNDFEPVVTRRHPEIGLNLRDLREIAGIAQLSGSGAAVFGIMNPEAIYAVENPAATVCYTQTSVSVEEVTEVT